MTVSRTADERGYYLGSDGFYYAKVTATPNSSYGSGYTFSTGDRISRNTTYYFKVEPIRWRILTTNDGKAFILCDSIIANQRYDSSSNNYKNSDVRAWLNETFYETAFTDLQKQIILTTEVDNGTSNSGGGFFPGMSENTNDKVFLLSYNELNNSAYGLTSNALRRMLTSDYARATGAYMSTNSSNYGAGYWWLRTPYNRYSNSNSVRYVNYDGSINNYSGGSVSTGNYGVVPAMWITL